MQIHTKIPIILDHDGSVDDFLSLILLLSMDQYDLKAVLITPADCYIESALETTLKILSIANRLDVEIGISACHGINAFPSNWRARPKILNALPDLINVEVEVDIDAYPTADTLLKEQLVGSKANLTYLMTGPSSNLANVLNDHPHLSKKISDVIWMGGAFNVPGNVVTYNHNGTAEWNVFWDPKAAKSLLQHDVSITFIPLDVTNEVGVQISFLQKLGACASGTWAHLACQFWATTLDTIPAYEYTYFMWDVLATSYLGIRDSFTIEHAQIDIESKGSSAGRTFHSQVSNHWANIATSVKKDIFYDYLFDSFSKKF